MAVARDFSIPLAILLIALLVYLLMLGRLSGMAFAWSLVGVAALVAVVAVVVPRSEDVSKISGKLGTEGGELLVEMQEIRSEVYAKAENVKRLTEQVGEISAFNVAQLWSFAPHDPKAARVQLRDKLGAMLREAGIQETRVNEIIQPINQRIEANLAHEVWNYVPKEPFAKPGQIKGQTPAMVSLKVPELLLQSEVGRAEAALRPYLEDLGVWTNEVEAKVRDFDEFRRTKQLHAHKGGNP